MPVPSEPLARDFEGEVRFARSEFFDLLQILCLLVFFEELLRSASEDPSFRFFCGGDPVLVVDAVLEPLASRVGDLDLSQRAVFSRLSKNSASVHTQGSKQQ